ncbi:isoflavone reductase family protein [Penicillium pulvis]|uniref:isoflavone reductase family protein n=1 Tax=Penicillium pulvis TaxID=1562058 RepID=UPI002546EA0A|nr:isoflavone reductase family protein [Penicillium pulvis]KAJ5810413.1 isoflavone reductase family protein [Penicillium pulvis]
MTFTKLIIAGSTGYVADHALRAISASTTPKFDVTILTRVDSGKVPSSAPGAKIIPVDYNDHSALVRAVMGADAILSFISGPPSKVIDLLLLKAAQEAGVRRIFPSEYTLDVLHPKQVSLFTEGGDWPEDTSPVVTARKFLALADEEGPTSFTTLLSSAFIDAWLEGNFGSFDPLNQKVTVIDSGDHYFSGCSLPFLGAAIVAVLQMDEGKTKNRRIPIAELQMTMNQVADAYNEATGVKFERLRVTSQQLIQQRNASLEAGSPLDALFIATHLGAFDGSGAADLKDGLEFDGDGFLNVRRQTLMGIAVKALQKVGAA